METLTKEQRAALIDRLDRSFQAMPDWVKVATKHAMAAPRNNPETGKPFTSFREVISVAADHTLITLKEDFESNDDLLPESDNDGKTH